MRLQLLWRGSDWVHGSRRALANSAYLAAGGALLFASYIDYRLGHDVQNGVSSATRTIFIGNALIGLVVSLVMVRKRQVWMALVTTIFSVCSLVGILMALNRGLFGARTSWKSLDVRSAVAGELVATAFSLVAALITIRGSRIRRGRTHPSTWTRSHS